MAAWRAHPPARLTFAVLLACAGYYGTGILAITLRLEPAGISTILTPVRHWWLYLAALLPVHLHVVSHFQGPVPLLVMFIQFGGNMVQAILGAIAVRRFLGAPTWGLRQLPSVRRAGTSQKATTSKERVR